MAVKKHTISFRESGQFSSLFMDYVENKDTLRSFYSYPPELASFGKAIADRRKLPVNRKLLVQVIREQYEAMPGIGTSDHPGVLENIDVLENENVFTVCTAHQPLLFTGPLYFIYKIITTIRLAERLKKEYPSDHFVPVFWIGSEDHDLEEIGTANIFGRKLVWNTDQRGAVGRMNTASLEPLLKELQQMLGTSDNAKQLSEIFERAYTENKTIAAATRSLVNELFGSYRLVVIDADDAKLKQAFLPFIKDDLTNNSNYKLVSESITALKAAGYDAQVNPREINVFHLTEADRIRIEAADETVLNLKPEEYSTNVVLRPLYQQMILPNIAYVGGPGEIAYWLEYKAMFDHHGIFFPVLMPRNFALLTDAKAEQQMEKFGLSATALFQDAELLVKEFVAKHSEIDISLKGEEQTIRTMFSELAVKAAAVDPTLKASVEGEMQKALAMLKNIETKMMRSEKQKQETSINQVRKLREKFLPEETLQERHDNFAPYYLKAGKSFIPELKEMFDPFEFKLLIIEL
ncbi:MAG: bacillithiol biosynthesis cysteine-adding enzyme BshC [Bacteroidia bacterium]